MTLNAGTAIRTLKQSLNQLEAERSDLAGGVRAVVPASEAGILFRTLRQEFDDTEWESKRDPSGDNIIVNIEADSGRGLGDLFE
jgi:hypothetical protein